MSILLRSQVCELLGCRVPIVLAGMGGVSRADLVAAVSAAGGFGFLGMVREGAELIVREVEYLRSLGHHRFGVNIIPAATDPALLEEEVAACIGLRVPVVSTFWDLDALLIARLRDAGIVVVHQVGSVAEAKAAERAGVEVIIAQGREAGGHVRGVDPLRQLLPAVAAAVNVPVLAAGGMTSGGDLVTAMALGAQGIVLGTAMLATHESFAHPYHKLRLLAAAADDTVLTTDFHINWPPQAPVRVLNSAVTSGARGNPSSTTKTVIGAENGRAIFLFSTDSPLRSMTGDFESMALYAGTGVGRIEEIVSAGDLLRDIVAEAETWLAIDQMENNAESSSPVCYASEMTGAYMGHFSESELSYELRILADDLQAALRELLAREADKAASREQPSFVDAATALARSSLLVQRLAASDRPSQASARAPLPRAPLDLQLIQASILGRLRTIIPRLPLGGTRHRLVHVLAFLANEWPVVRIRPAPSPLPRRSTESHAASDQ